MIGLVDWLLLVVVMTWTVVMLIHVGKLGKAFRQDDWTMFRALNRQTMWMVGVWQICLGTTMGVWNVTQEGGSWVSVVTLVGSGLGIIVLDRVARRLGVGAYER